VIYAAFTVWLLLILFTAMGIYRLWSRMIPPAYVNWALLPGTVVSEMAYIFGCLITGGEVRRAKLMPGKVAKRKGESESEPTTEAAPRLKIIGPIIAALLAVVACGAAILIVHALLSEPVLAKFLGSMPKSLPVSWGELWKQIHGQADLLRHMSQTWFKLEWTNWRVPLFVYLAICLSIRLAPVRRDLRATLAAVVVIAALIALVGLISVRFDGLMHEIWPLVTYIWGLLLFLLVVTLILWGLISLIRVLFGKSSA